VEKQIFFENDAGVDFALPKQSRPRRRAIYYIQ
jgi:hypothetical protein